MGTALAAAIFTALMGLMTNLPFALASGLGINAVVAFDLILGRGLTWQVAMSCIVIEGLIAVVLVVAGLREAIMRAVPHEIKLSIGVGIGLFIALSGSATRGSPSTTPATGIGLGMLTGSAPMIALGRPAPRCHPDRAQLRGPILTGSRSRPSSG